MAVVERPLHRRGSRRRDDLDAPVEKILGYPVGSTSALTKVQDDPACGCHPKAGGV